MPSTSLVHPHFPVEHLIRGVPTRYTQSVTGRPILVFDCLSAGLMKRDKVSKSAERLADMEPT